MKTRGSAGRRRGCLVDACCAPVWNAWKSPGAGRRAERNSQPVHSGSTAICSGCSQACQEESTALYKGVEQLIDRAVQILVAAAQGVDLVDGMQDGGVVLAAELSANLRQRGRGKLLDQVHGNLAGEGDGFGIAPHLQILLAQPELLADTLLDELDGDLLFLRGDEVF